MNESLMFNKLPCTKQTIGKYEKRRSVDSKERSRSNSMVRQNKLTFIKDNENTRKIRQTTLYDRGMASLQKKTRQANQTDKEIRA